MITPLYHLGSRKTVASFDIDAQKTFTPLCPHELPVPEGQFIVPELNAQAQFADYRIGSKEAHHPQALWVATAAAPQLTPVVGKNVDVRWRPHGIPGTLGFELLDGLPAIDDYDFFVWKGIELDMHPYGSCYHDLAGKLSTGVIEFLRQQQVTTVIAGGLALDYCVKTTVLQLLQAGFRVVVNLAACRALSPEGEALARQSLTEAGAILVTDAAVLQVE